VLDMARNRSRPPSFVDPPEWLMHLQGFDTFQVRPTAGDGWSAFPEGVDEHVEFPGGTWRVSLVLPHDLSITTGGIDPIVLLVLLADGSAVVDDKIEQLVAFCRASGKTWTQIGQALGMTKQSAWEKYSGEE